MEQERGNITFIHQQFREWYRENSHTIRTPKKLMQREFAFLHFNNRNMHRHIHYKNPRHLQQYLENYAPAHSYHSTSYYLHPSAEMAEKDWQGADLVFDIDADHFNLPCQKIHDKWICNNCDEHGTGSPPEICRCGKAQFTTETWLCEKCLQAAKHETQKLQDILIQDFGFNPEKITTNFSGNRGYHVHVQDPYVRTLSQGPRREIVDYIMATGLESTFHGFNTQKRGHLPTLSEKGWRGRIGRALYDYIQETPSEKIKSLKLSKKSTKNIIENKDKILEILIQKHPSNIIPQIDSNSLNLLLKQALPYQASEIDTVVTTDIHRLIRLPGTLHGKTGWQVQTIPYGTLSDYDPFTRAIVITGSHIKLEFKKVPQITINHITYGPYDNETAEIPLEVALYYLAKKGARIKS